MFVLNRTPLKTTLLSLIYRRILYNFKMILKLCFCFTVLPKILQTSGCELQSETLTCTCISEGFPLPTIKWPLLKNHTKYSVITIIMSEHTVNSTISLTVKDHNSTVECFSSNDVGEVQQHFNIIRPSKRKYGERKHLTMSTSHVLIHIQCLFVSIYVSYAHIFPLNNKQKPGLTVAKTSMFSCSSGNVR